VSARRASSSIELSNDRVGIGAALLALLAALLWGGNQPFIKIGLSGMPPLAMAAARFAIGLGVVSAAAAIAGVSLRMHRSHRLRLLALSALFTLQIAFLNEGTQLTSASRASILISAHPFFIALFCHLWVPGDRLTGPKVAGIALAFAGMLLIFGDAVTFGDYGHFFRGDLLVFGSAILLGLRHVVLKRLLHDMHPYAVLFWQSMLSLPAFCLLAFLLEREVAWNLTGPVIAAVLYQGIVVAGLCFILWMFLLRRHSASRLGIFGFATPILGVLLSMVLLQEEATVQLIFSMLLVAAGIAVVNWKR
jgi:drug/metabolite transporter (DMT)-like permease